MVATLVGWLWGRPLCGSSEHYLANSWRIDGTAVRGLQSEPHGPIALLPHSLIAA